MAPIKRPAAKSEPEAKKAKTTVGSIVSKKCKEVGVALKKADGFPPHVREMLAENLHYCLGVCKEERHEFQETVIKMVADVLGSIQANLEAEVRTTEGKIVEAESEHSLKQVALQDAEALVATKSAATVTAQQELVAHEKDLVDAQAALRTAEAEQKAGDASAVEASNKKETLQTALTTLLLPLKEGSSLSTGNAKQSITELSKLGKELRFDTSLLTSLPAALGKEPASRGHFDVLVITQVQTQLEEEINSLSKTLEAAEPEREARAAKVAEAKSAVDICVEREAAFKDTLKAAKVAQKEAEEAQKAAVKTLKQLGSEMKQVAAFLEEAKASLNEFLEGPLATFKELQVRSSAPPVQVEEPHVVTEGDVTAA